jgi:hypothetical protein
VNAWSETAALVTSAVVSILVTYVEFQWPATPFSPNGVLSAEGRLLVVAASSIVTAWIAILATPRPDPAMLVEFYRRVRPIGAWGPVRALAGTEAVRGELGPALVGSAGALALTFGLLFGLGFLFLDRPLALGIAAVATVAGGFVTAWALNRLSPRRPAA